MSKDFELLQRLEQGWERSSTFHDSMNSVVSIPTQTKAPEIAQMRAIAATPPSAHLAPAVRNELNKLVFRTFLSTPAVAVMMFTGVEAHEDAKWVAACTADVLANATRNRVCLLDADLAFPTVHRACSVSNEDGLAAVLRRSCSISDATIRVDENLWVVPAGTTPGDLQMTAAAFQEVVAGLLEHFEYLIISAPDSERYAELGAVGTATEGAVLVLDSNTTRRVSAKQAKASLEMANVRILGSVFNNRSFPVPDLFYAHM
jgi:Mrp family chromosome partitioning ATPase